MAATDANVFIVIFGEAGDTGKRWLKKAKDSKEPFGKGSVSIGKLKLSRQRFVFMRKYVMNLGAF